MDCQKEDGMDGDLGENFLGSSRGTYSLVLCLGVLKTQRIVTHRNNEGSRSSLFSETIFAKHDRTRD